MLVVADAWQDPGLGTRLMTCLIQAARESGVDYLDGGVLACNTRMLQLMQRPDFSKTPDPDDPGLYRVCGEL